MTLKIHYLVDGSKEATGIVVIIDVLRACTTIPILLENHAEEIIPVKTLEDAEGYKGKDYVLIGEGEDGHIHHVFDYNNSPSEIYQQDFRGKKIILRSNNATQAILNAEKASEIVLASFVNLDAIVKYIQGHHLTDITIVSLGRLGKRGLEDDLCAEAIRDRLEGKNIDFEDISKKVFTCDCAVLVRETLKRPDDVILGLKLNSYPIVPKVYFENDKVVIKKI